jgi:hypothetical protein
MLQNNEPLSFGELMDAWGDGRLTDSEMETYQPGLLKTQRELMESVKASFPLQSVLEAQENLQRMMEPIRRAALSMSGISDVIARTQDSVKRMASLADMSRITAPAMPNLSAAVVQRPELTALGELRSEVADLAEISAVTGEHISSLANLASDGMQGMLRLEVAVGAILKESGELRSSIDEGQEEAAKSGRVITRLTWAVVFLTVVLVVLTAVLVFRR